MHLTDPLDRDSDGDLFGDEHEVLSGTDPNDPFDFPNGPPPPPGAGSVNVPALSPTGLMLLLAALIGGVVYAKRFRGLRH